MAKRSVLITGSSRGLGRSLAVVFAKSGYDVIVHGQDEGALAQTREEVLNSGAACDVVRGDLTSSETIDRLYDAAQRRDLDVLINNAGVYVNQPFQSTSPETFREVIEINLVAPILLTRRVFPLFQKKRSGLVLNINSVAGKSGSDGESAYSVSKHGLRGFAGSIQREANRDGVRVLEVYLGTMNTGMVAGRRDPAQCIRTDEAAELICSLCKDYPSLRIDEIDLSRRIYR